MTASEFISAVEPLPDHNYFWFEEADTSLGQHAFSRAYINFKERDDIELFTDKFDGYVSLIPRAMSIQPVSSLHRFKRFQN